MQPWAPTDAERPLLQAALDDPTDAATRQVYADWLREQAGPADEARAELLELGAALVARRDPELPALRERYASLRAERMDDWRFEAPDDPDRRQAYVDRLRAEGSEDAVARAELIVLHDRLARPDDEATAALRARIEELAPLVPAAWLALIDRVDILTCARGQRLALYERHQTDAIIPEPCPMRWEALRPTLDASVRYCDSCATPVYRCDTVEDARAHAVRHRCVALAATVAGGEGLDVPTPFSIMVMGRPTPPDGPEPAPLRPSPDDRVRSVAYDTEGVEGLVVALDPPDAVVRDDDGEHRVAARELVFVDRPRQR